MKKYILAAFLGTIFSAAAGNSETVNNEAAATGETIIKSADIDVRIDGQWTISTVGSHRITGEERPHLTFDLGEMRLYGNNGCNVVNGNIVFGEGNAICFNEVITTNKYCPDAKFEHYINLALNDVRSYRVSSYTQEYYLDLYNAQGHLIMVLRKHNMDFLNGAWRVTAIDGNPNTNEALEFVIDIPEGRLHGNTGCNIVNGEIFIDPEVSNSVQFSHLAATRMACPDAELEASVLVALEEVEKAYITGDDTVNLINHAGQTVLQLRRLNPRDTAE